MRQKPERHSPQPRSSGELSLMCSFPLLGRSQVPVPEAQAYILRTQRDRVASFRRPGGLGPRKGNHDLPPHSGTLHLPPTRPFHSHCVPGVRWDFGWHQKVPRLPSLWSFLSPTACPSHTHANGPRSPSTPLPTGNLSYAKLIKPTPCF